MSRMLKKINSVLNAMTVVLLLVVSSFITKLNILPNKFYWLLVCVVLIVIALFIFNIFKNNKKSTLIVSIIISIITSMILSFVFVYLNSTNNLLKNINHIKETSVYYVVVNKKYDYKNIEDIENKSIGLYSIEKTNYNKAYNKLIELVNINKKSYSDFNSYFDDFMNDKVDAILINSNTKNILDENNSNFKSNAKVLKKIRINISNKKDNTVNVNSDKFNILITGIDTDGDISKTSRSDVNIIVTINRKTNQIVLTTTPRDMEVQLHGTDGLTDKLTHAGIYGADMSRQTLEDFYDIKIPYYIRVNFTSVVGIVDAIGGVDIDNDIAFSDGTYYFPKGNIHLNGKKALAYARNRHQMPSGDYNRGLHQEEIIKAMITKITHSSELLTNYSEITNELSYLFQTNIPESVLKKYIRCQLDKNPKWDINYYSVGGGPEDHKYTYSMPNIKLYIITPYQPEIERTHNIITGILNDKKYEDVSDRLH